MHTGSVRLVKFSQDGKEVMVRLVKPDEIFAEVILFENTSYPVTAIAGDDTELFALNKRAFQDLLSEESFRNGFFQHASLQDALPGGTYRLRFGI